MAYSDFSLTSARKKFNLIQKRSPLFEQIPSIEPTAWLRESLQKSSELVIDTEKARSELIVMPILLTSRELNEKRFSIYSGESLDVDSTQGLNGECDFILTFTAPLSAIQSPIITMVEAKKNDIDANLGQCVAQMVGARLFNKNDNSPIETIYGCVTTGEIWQFLKLEENFIYIDANRYYRNDIDKILGIFQLITQFFVR